MYHPARPSLPNKDGFVGNRRTYYFDDKDDDAKRDGMQTLRQATIFVDQPRQSQVKSVHSAMQPTMMRKKSANSCPTTLHLSLSYLLIKLVFAMQKTGLET